MKKIKAFNLIGRILLSLGLFIAVGCTKKVEKNDWSNVLNGQGQSEFKNLQKLIKESECDKLVLPEPDQLEKLMDKFKAGNEWVFKNVVTAYICFETESQAKIDANGGLFFDAKPKQFVKYIKDLDMNFLLFKFLINIPEKYADDMQKQKSMYESRLSELEKLTIDVPEKKDTVSALELKLDLVNETIKGS